MRRLRALLAGYAAARPLTEIEAKHLVGFMQVEPYEYHLFQGSAALEEEGVAAKALMESRRGHLSSVSYASAESYASNRRSSR